MIFKYSDIKRIKKHIYNELDIKTKYKIRIMKNYDCVSVIHNGKETRAWAAMSPVYKMILLPIANKKYHTWVPNLYVCFAHELIHVWQYENGLEFNEEQADSMALEYVNELFEACIGFED
jgi:hypothetical protein